jgi:hypothetical protein
MEVEETKEEGMNSESMLVEGEYYSDEGTKICRCSSEFGS